MANKSYYEMTDEEFAVWYANMSAEATANQNDLKMIPAARITKTATEDAAFQTQLAETRAAADILESKKAALAAMRAVANADASFYNKSLKADKSTPASLIELLGFDVDKPKSRTAPDVPLDCAASGASNGDNTVIFKRNGNGKTTVFTVEYQIAGAAAWLIAGTTTSQKFVHKNQTPGVQIKYRVYASRGGENSSSSNTAIVY